jgi:hypothetical protein
VLKAVDDINLLLEDMGLNLQSMMASPHARPFSDKVRLWEQRLSLIGEAIEVGWSPVRRGAGLQCSGGHRGVVCTRSCCSQHQNHCVPAAGVDAGSAQVDVPGVHLQQVRRRQH